MKWLPSCGSESLYDEGLILLVARSSFSRF